MKFIKDYFRSNVLFINVLNKNIMKTSVLQRVSQLITHYKLSKNAFANKINMEQTTVNNQLIGKRGISIDLIMNVLSAFPEISSEWLLRGEGSMLREKKFNNEHFPNSNFSIFTIREIGDKTTFERSVAINMNQVKAIEDHATTCRIIMVDGKEYEILCGFSDFIKR